ncbi:hypothetical protein HU200_011035 [Digitaria exilis]|uniref:Uncharacterized protein n=1 Tax=Digitaria exilis TaxID=1010633 RepID=A0A835KLQ6_9POAL|nr:hypothetical protein HU200_011035 [Digitaria exilis]
MTSGRGQGANFAVAGGTALLTTENGKDADLARQPRCDRLYPVAGLAMGQANNPRFVASDGVPPEAMIVGFRGTSAYWRSDSLRLDSLYRRSNSLPRSSDEEIPATARSSAYLDLVFITVLLNPSRMGSKIDQDDIPANIEGLDEKGHQKYLMALAHLQSQFLKGFKNDQDTVTRVQEFVMPSFKMSDDKIEVIDTPVRSPHRLGLLYYRQSDRLQQAVRPARRSDQLQQAVRPANTMVVQRR